MAGALDARGIYIYDLTDNEPTIADLLNLGQEATSNVVANLTNTHNADKTATNNRVTALETVSSATVTAAAGTGFTGSITAHKNSAGIVTLAGALGGTPTAGSPAGTGFAALTLPAGYRPANQFKAVVGSSAYTNGNFRFIGFGTDGTVQVLWSGTWPATQSTGGSGLFLDGITFKAAS